jgi:hypothetical protein
MRPYRKLVLHRRVIVNLTDGSAMDGVIWDERGELIVLRDAQLHVDGGSTPLDGEVIVDRARVAFVQVPA